MSRKKDDSGFKPSKAVLGVIADLEKKYGEGVLIQVSSDKVVPVDTIPTGSLALDIATGVGGYPLGRITEVYGPESSGKTTLCYHAMAEAQKKFPNKMVGFVDMEHAGDNEYAKNIGVDLDRMYVAQPDYGEQALEITEALIRSGEFSLIVVDSVAALVPKKEIEGEMGDATMGQQARLMSQAMRKLSGVIKKSNCVVIFTNQIRMKIGVFFGSPETTTGGQALKFYASLRMDVRKTQQVKEEQVAVANETRVRVVKNKVAPPFREAEFTIKYGTGIDPIAEIIAMGTQYEIIIKRGAFFSYKEERIGQGVENSKAFLRERPELAEQIKGEILEHVKTLHDVAAKSSDSEVEE